ncbi:hypothetical protein QAD02_013140 [Eretmocerus hayati]|uniref:Uncharacterized protein n=1 Tax=Eretmocerus hayati TaxID=131215 RepID=A0ACC2P2L8_9HYME|nr:hypothetical protein QAD02_013140 [Eretmocerus hayati]
MNASYSIPSAEALHMGKKRETEKDGLHGELTDASHSVSLAEVRHTGIKWETERKRIARGAYRCISFGLLGGSTPDRERTINGKKNRSHGKCLDAPYLFPLAKDRHTGKKRET